MTALVQHAPSARVMIIDDDDDGREELVDGLRELDLQPYALIGHFGNDLDRMIAEIEEYDPFFVICDHRLQAKGLAQFYGLDLVKRLIERQRPSMLVTMYQSSDRLEFRQARHAVPVIVAHDQFRFEAIGSYFDICRREIAADPVDERKPHRSLIRVDAVSDNLVDVVVPSWSPDHAVPIPMTCIDETVRGKVLAGIYLIGDVNIGAKSEDDLFFANVNEMAPPPKEELA